MLMQKLLLIKNQLYSYLITKKHRLLKVIFFFRVVLHCKTNNQNNQWGTKK